MKMDFSKVALITSLLVASKSLNRSKSQADNTEDYIGGSGVIVTIDGTNDMPIVLNEVIIPLKEQDSIIDVTARALLLAGVPFELTGIGRDASFVSIDGITQKGEGSEMAWLYSVDGVFPEQAPALYTPIANERISWVYTTPDNETYTSNVNIFRNRKNNLVNY